MAERKTAIILQGGALRAAFAAGVACTLLKRGVGTIDYVAGTSSSSLTAAYLAANQLEDIKSVWTRAVGTPHFISLSNIFKGKPVFDIDYLIEGVFRARYPLNVEALSVSKTTWVIPLFDYKKNTTIFKSSKDHDFKDHVWNLMRVSCIVHSDQLLRGTNLENYVDGALDPYSLFRTPWLPEGSRVFVIWSEANSGWHPMKRIGSFLFQLLQTRGFPEEIKTMIRKRRELIISGEGAYKEFKKRHHVIDIRPMSDAWYESLLAIDPNQRRISALFEEGEQVARLK